MRRPYFDGSGEHDSRGEQLRQQGARLGAQQGEHTEAPEQNSLLNKQNVLGAQKSKWP
jgi:hypothetical protein